MAGDELSDGKPRDPTEERLLRRLRFVSGFVILAMIVLLIVVDTLGRLFVDPNFHIDELALGTLIGALLLLLGIEGINRLPGIGGRR
jgi:hypothetical protein